MVFALAVLIAAWNCGLQSENWMATGVADELADAELLALVPAELDWVAVVGGVLVGLGEVQAVPVSSSAAATSTGRRRVRRLKGTR